MPIGGGTRRQGAARDREVHGMSSPNRAAVRVRPRHGGGHALEVHPSLDGISNEDTNWDDAFWRHDRQASDEAQGLRCW